MDKVWVSGAEYLGISNSCCYNYNDKRFLEFRASLMSGLKKEVKGLIPLLKDPIIVNAHIKRTIENPNMFIRVLTTKERTHIYGLIIMSISEGFFTKKALTFPLTTLTEKSSKKDIFKLVKECKRLIAELREKVDYVYLETVLNGDKVAQHNKRILEWYNQEYSNSNKLYEVYVAKVEGQ